MSPSTATARCEVLAISGEQVQRGQHRVRAGVVGVINQRRVAQARDDHQAQLAAHDPGAGDDLRPAQPIGQADRGGAQRRVDAVPAEHGQLDVEGFGAVVAAEADALQPLALDLVGPQVASGFRP